MRVGRGLVDVHLGEHDVRGVALVLQDVETPHAGFLQRRGGVAPGLGEERLDVLRPDVHMHVDDEHRDLPVQASLPRTILTLADHRAPITEHGSPGTAIVRPG